LIDFTCYTAIESLAHDERRARSRKSESRFYFNAVRLLCSRKHVLWLLSTKSLNAIIDRISNTLGTTQCAPRLSELPIFAQNASNKYYLKGCNIKVFLPLLYTAVSAFDRLYLRAFLQIESLPLNPGGQPQINPFTWSSHVPPCWHGSLIHSLTSVSHVEPAKLTGELKPQHKDYSSCERVVNIVLRTIEPRYNRQ